jgi:organic radical activating enzyme
MHLFEHPYQTINGEAEHIGKPCVFVRFQGCHVACKWCDAMGTWPTKDTKFTYTNESLMDYLDEHFKHTQRIWITGGEPMEHFEEIKSLWNYAKDYRPIPRTWHLITSGSVYDEKTLLCFDHITIDIKPPSAHANTNAANNSFIPLCMEHMDISETVEFKMVVNYDEKDIEFAENMIDKLAQYGRDITIQPMYWSEAEVKTELSKAQTIQNTKPFLEGFTQPKTWPSYGEFAERFMNNGYKNLRVLPQMHKIFWPGEMNGI